MPKAGSRPSFATSSSDFALPPSSSANGVASTSSVTLDEPNILLQRFRRPSLLVPKTAFLSETRLSSPLTSSFTFHTRRRSRTALFNEESESDRERMSTDSSSGSSGNPTPPLKGLDTTVDDSKDKPKFSKPPSTPPRRLSIPSTSMDVQEATSPFPGTRFSFPIRPPRILNLLSESRPEENEFKSEAAFQRLIHSCSELPRTPRPATDRGRYPEEAVQEDPPQDDPPSDDDEVHPDESPFAYSIPGGSEPIPIKKPGSCSGSHDDLGMSISQTSSNGALSMDIDVPPSPSMSMSSIVSNGWRYTPPPTTSAVRSNKRKLDDRFDPYPASKRRAVSPSFSYLRDAHTNMGSPINGRNGRLPISIPVSIPGSTVNSATSSPTIGGGSYPGSYSRSMSITSSPTLRSTMLLASPILRPVPRLGKRGEEEEREIDGTGDAVNGLTLA